VHLSEDCTGFSGFSAEAVCESRVYALPDAGQCHSLTCLRAEVIHYILQKERNTLRPAFTAAGNACYFTAYFISIHCWI